MCGQATPHLMKCQTLSSKSPIDQVGATAVYTKLLLRRRTMDAGQLSWRLCYCICGLHICCHVHLPLLQGYPVVIIAIRHISRTRFLSSTQYTETLSPLAF